MQDDIHLAFHIIQFTQSLQGKLLGEATDIIGGFDFY